MIYSHEIGIILVIAVCTFATRVFPFVLFGRSHQPTPIIQYLGKILPSAVIAILIIYCLKSVSFSHSAAFAPQFIGVAVVVALHVWKRNNLLSIGLGTICYMIMVQFLFKYN